MWTSRFDPDSDSNKKGNLFALWNIGKADAFTYSRRIEDIEDEKDLTNFKKEALDKFTVKKDALEDHAVLTDEIANALNESWTNVLNVTS